jgi:hypothetical protein
MGYYMRFFDVSDEAIDLQVLDAALRGIDSAYHIDVFPETNTLQGELHHHDVLYGEIEINQPGDGLFDDEIQEQLESIEEAGEGDNARVEDTLRSAKRTIVVRLLWQDRDPEESLERLDALWFWLQTNRNGLLQADGEGFYDADGLILAVQ